MEFGGRTIGQWADGYQHQAPTNNPVLQLLQQLD
jgi:hypothetical protein